MAAAAGFICQPRKLTREKETLMSDFRNDPNFAQHDVQEYDSRIQWAAVAVILLLVGGLIAAAVWTGGDTQTAMNSPRSTVETTGSGGSMGSAATMPEPPRQLRH
jgi:hypothetical protein